MIKTLIFSKDRPAQLHLLLESIHRHDINQVFRPSVLYLSSNSAFGEGYRKTKEHFPGVTFIQQSVSFKKDVLNWLDRCHYLCMFLVDDQIMYSNMTTTEDNITSLLHYNGNFGTVSLRLGSNTVHNYQSNASDIPRFCDNREEFLVWNSFPQSPTSNWGYPLSVDAHIFRTTDIAGLTIRLPFRSPNTYEEQLCMQKAYFSPMMACLQQSVFVNNPMNLVQDTHKNRHSGFMSAEELCDRYLEGQVFDLDYVLEHNTITACHQELEVALI